MEMGDQDNLTTQPPEGHVAVGEGRPRLTEAGYSMCGLWTNCSGPTSDLLSQSAFAQHPRGDLYELPNFRGPGLDRHPEVHPSWIRLTGRQIEAPWSVDSSLSHSPCPKPLAATH